VVQIGHSNRRLILLILAVSILIAFNFETLSATRKPGAPSALASADRAYMALDYKTADSLYTAIIQTEPSNADVYWKLSRLNICIAESFLPTQTARRMPFYTKAVEYARKSVTIDSTNAGGHTWLAASLAVKADRIGAKEKLRLANQIKRELDKALRLNPNDDVAWSMLGSYYRQTSKISWFNRLVGNTFVGSVPEANAKAAEQAFRKAISLNPRVIRHHHEFALLLIDQHRQSEALQILQTAVNKPVLMKSDVRRLEEIRALIQQLSRVDSRSSALP
jgi:tetratricopeptide (TPR) repeat protein